MKSWRRVITRNCFWSGIELSGGGSSARQQLTDGKGEWAMKHPIPAPGFVKISGKRKPPKHMGDKLWCQLRSGWVDRFGPWPVETTRWVWDGTEGDVVAVKKAE